MDQEEQRRRVQERLQEVFDEKTVYSGYKLNDLVDVFMELLAEFEEVRITRCKSPR